MPSYRVIAEFIDKETGRRCFPGEVVDITSSARVNKLAGIGVIDPEPVETNVQEAAQEDSAEQEGNGQPQATAEEQLSVVPEEEKPVKAKAKAK
ncbi:hypothetical protein [Moorella sp. E306M]|uniref:hypothetical protein n=1 Tax=Moorella sp. E306M TaxID=2572683 RepID=UPI0010FFB410|nr:hypothetical protein [Moorella sp. E306M]GEA17504.1 hypothetical protein E306M_06380 [Moorella sp. E306M]